MCLHVEMSSDFVFGVVFLSSVIIKNFFHRHRNRIRLSSNSLICTLFNSVHFSKCKLKEEWDTILRK